MLLKQTRSFMGFVFSSQMSGSVTVWDVYDVQIKHVLHIDLSPIKTEELFFSDIRVFCDSSSDSQGKVCIDFPINVSCLERFIKALYSQPA